MPGYMPQNAPRKVPQGAPRKVMPRGAPQSVIRKRQRPSPRPVENARPFNPVPLVLALVGAVVLGLIFKGTGRTQSGVTVQDPGAVTTPQAKAGPARVPPPAPETRPVDVVADETGRVLRVAAQDPAGALRAFCAHQTAGMTPRWIIPAFPPSGRARRGIVSPMDDPLALLEVPIWLDRNAGVWVIGSGRHPVDPKPAQEIPPGTPRIPVETPGAD